MDQTVVCVCLMTVIYYISTENFQSTMQASLGLILGERLSYHADIPK